jgi:hypothetical protein
MIMQIRYTIPRRLLSDEELIQSYHSSLRSDCEIDFIRILEDTIANRGLELPVEGEEKKQT